MDYDQLKAGVKEIAEIASSVPEQFRDKCFELLLSSLLREGDGATEESKKDPKEKPDSSKEDARTKSDQPKGEIPITTQLRVLMKRTGVTKDEIEKLLLYDDGQVHFIKEPHPKGITTGQMEWALLLALKNAILNDSLSTDPEDVRSVCQEKGNYDKTNFAGVFKTDRNAKLFRKALVKQGPAEPLSSDGQDALGELIKRLASEVSNEGRNSKETRFLRNRPSQAEEEYLGTHVPRLVGNSYALTQKS